MDDLEKLPAAAARGTFIGLHHLPYLGSASSVATEDGTIPAGWVRAGDLVVTRDRGLQPVLSIGLVETDAAQASGDPVHWPIEIAPGALGSNLPEAPMVVPPRQRILVRGAEVQLMFGVTEAFATVGHLLGWPGIQPVRPDGLTTGYQLLLERHEVILVDGQWTESLFLDTDALEDVRRADPDALLRFGGHRQQARPDLSEWEVSLLTPPRDFRLPRARVTA